MCTAKLKPTPWEKLPDPPPSFTVESSLSKELLKLSFNDRNEIEEEMHGVRCRAVDETPDLIEEALKKFDSQLNERKEREPELKVLRNVVRVSNEDPGASVRCYVNDPDVRLRFLRCEFFVVESAVQRFIVFLEFMSELFGDFVADRPVQRSDFTLEEEKALKKSRSQYLPFRDRSGRRVCASFGYCNYELQSRTTFKIFMYLHWMVSHDVETQRRGVVFHSYVFDEGTEKMWEKIIRPQLKKDLSDNQKKVYDGLPVRMVGLQVYYRDTPFFRLLATLYVHSIDPKQRAITKIQFGELTEVLYKMASVGLPVDLMPVTSTGTVKFTKHCAWLDAIEKLQTQYPTQKLSDCNDGREIVDCPGCADVVFRSGQSSRHNPGNSYYRELMDFYRPDHLKADKRQKVEITKLVIDSIKKKRKGRFLEWCNKGNTWVVIQDQDVVRRKIAKAFKHLNRSIRGTSLSRKLNEMIEVTKIIHDSDDDSRKGPDSVSTLQEYYSKEHPSKRLKSFHFACFKGIGGDDALRNESDACFGKNFFSTES